MKLDMNPIEVKNQMNTVVGLTSSQAVYTQGCELQNYVVKIRELWARLYQSKSLGCFFLGNSTIRNICMWTAN